jgi:Asp-tRNA(Asn)/Glu-tRNA(Gln) amidotransferase A subunit family amidase
LNDKAPGSVRGLSAALRNGGVRPVDVARAALRCANGNASRNTYLWRDEAWTLREAERAEAMAERGPLWGLPVSVKDCFDLAGAPTSCGVRFYREANGNAAQDSWLVEKLRAAGAVITGKTHLHPLAYGITGENPEFGDCVQPGDAGALTGGSSSGAAASVLEGSAAAAIGTDTGGSIRVPAALCGLAGYRATLGRGDWRGAGHLAPSFDTMGWLFRELEDAPLLGRLYAPAVAAPQARIERFALIDAGFLHDCEPDIVEAMERLATRLELIGLRREQFTPTGWNDSFSIFAPIQASEAALIHAGHYEIFEPSIRERLEWGARLTDQEVALLRERHAEFRAGIDALIEEHQLLVMPASPVRRLPAAANHSQTRPRLLRYTTPFSLAGVPVVTVPCAVSGMQLAAARGNDEALLELARALKS